MKTAAILLVVLVASPASGAQQESRSPLTGNWGAEGRTMLELREEAGNVSGRAFFNQGANQTILPITNGTFDPGTGTLRISGEVTLPGVAGQTAWVMDGTLNGEVLTVTVTLGGAPRGTRTLTQLAGAGAAPTPPAAPGTVLVTGANRGLGFEFAKQYAARGWTVIATVRNPEAATELRALAASNPKITIERLDLLERPGITALANRHRGRPIDLLINNAGIGGDVKGQTLGSFDYATFEEAMAVNVYGALAMAEAFRQNVTASTHKKIVSITSGWGILSLPRPPGPYFYRASKVALNMVMRALAADLRPQGVIVAVLTPGSADTELRRQLQGNSNAPPPAEPVAAMIKVIDGLTPQNSDAPLNYDGTPLPW